MEINHKGVLKDIDWSGKLEKLKSIRPEDIGKSNDREEKKSTPTFDGRATIRVRFRSRLDYEKFRKYILKTDWTYEMDYPMWEELNVEFHNTEDIEIINRNIIFLLQNGFEVYCCRYALEEQLAEEEHPVEEDVDTDGDIPAAEFDLNKFENDLWEKFKKTSHSTINEIRRRIKNELKND